MSKDAKASMLFKDKGESIMRYIVQIVTISGSSYAHTKEKQKKEE